MTWYASNSVKEPRCAIWSKSSPPSMLWGGARRPTATTGCSGGQRSRRLRPAAGARTAAQLHDDVNVAAILKAVLHAHEVGVRERLELAHHAALATDFGDLGLAQRLFGHDFDGAAFARRLVHAAVHARGGLAAVRARGRTPACARTTGRGGGGSALARSLDGVTPGCVTGPYTPMQLSSVSVMA